MKRLPLFTRGMLLISILLLAQNCPAALNAYLQLRLNGIDIAGESTIATMGGVDVSDQIECIAFNHELFLTGGTRKTHGPVKIVKRVDKSSPLLYEGFDKNQNTSATFRFFRRNPGDGSIEHYFTITLENARISGIRHWFPNTTDSQAAALPEMEEVSFTYQSITVTHVIGGTEAVLTVTP